VLQAVLDAKSTESDKVAQAMTRLRYDWYKGPQFYRACDHQSVQSVIVVESKAEKDMKGKDDVFNIAHIEAPSEANLRSCSELGFKA
jgi:branched-chain amino acid transport system substrate-binding protein